MVKMNIAQQLLMDVCHVQFQQNMWSGLYMEKSVYGFVQSGLSNQSIRLKDKTTDCRYMKFSAIEFHLNLITAFWYIYIYGNIHLWPSGKRILLRVNGTKNANCPTVRISHIEIKKKVKVKDRQRDTKSTYGVLSYFIKLA
jgi:hypothetical protein